MTPRTCLTGLLLAASLLAQTPPALAGADDVALLNGYIGKWHGRGTANIDGETETVACVLDVQKANVQTKINYKGKCALAGTPPVSIAGTMAYIEQEDRFEAVMSSSTRFSGGAIAHRSGKTISFDLKDSDQNGKDYAIASQIGLTGNRIDVNFTVVDLAKNKTARISVPFEK